MNLERPTKFTDIIKLKHEKFFDRKSIIDDWLLTF